MTDMKIAVREVLERIWKNNSGRIAGLDHQLVVLAVPTYPANIEAVSALDLSDIADLLAIFTKHREEHPDELRAIEPAAGESPQPPDCRVEAGERRGQAGPGDAEQVGQGHHGGGAPEERPDAPAEAHEGDAAARPLVDMSAAGKSEHDKAESDEFLMFDHRFKQEGG